MLSAADVIPAFVLKLMGKPKLFTPILHPRIEGKKVICIRVVETFFVLSDSGGNESSRLLRHEKCHSFN